jgi:hypothetical protein
MGHGACMCMCMRRDESNEAEGKGKLASGLTRMIGPRAPENLTHIYRRNHGVRERQAGPVHNGSLLDRSSSQGLVCPP